MQLQLAGSTKISASRERVFGLLTDASFLAKTIPDADLVRVLDSTTLEARIRLRVSMVSSALKIRLTVVEKEPPVSARLIAEGSGSGSTIKMSSIFKLEGDSPVTMTWSADGEVGGVMAGLGSTLLKSFASKKVEELFCGISDAVEGAASGQ